MKAGIRFVIPLVLTVAALSATAQDIKALWSAMEVKWPENRTLRIVFHGHSVPAGYHKTPEVKTFESYPHLFHVWLKERFPHAVVNVIVTAKGGEDSVEGAERFERDVLIHKPDLIFIDYALNDRRKSMEDVEMSWRSMIGLAKEHRIPVVLITPTGDARADLRRDGDPLKQRADMIRRISREEEVLLADVSAAWLAELGKGTHQSELLSQVNHPNLRGHLIALQAIVASLESEVSDAKSSE